LTDSDNNKVTDQIFSTIVNKAITWTAHFAINTYTVTASGSNGTVTGVGTYNYGTKATLTAVPNTGYHFVKWSDNIATISRDIIVTSNTSLTAIFAINVYSVSASGVNGSVTGVGTYNYGSKATLKAIPNVNYYFVKWSDGNTNAERDISVTNNVNLTAIFTIYTYTISASGTNGTISGTGVYNYGSTATLVATPNANYHFIKWSDGYTGASRVITVTNNVSLVAYFEGNSKVISASQVTNDGYENDGGIGGVVNGAGTYPYGTTIVLTATPNTNYHFVKWSDGNTSANRNITVTDSVNLVAYFEGNIEQVDVNTGSYYAQTYNISELNDARTGVISRRAFMWGIVSVSSNKNIADFREMDPDHPGRLLPGSTCSIPYGTVVEFKTSVRGEDQYYSPIYRRIHGEFIETNCTDYFIDFEEPSIHGEQRILGKNSDSIDIGYSSSNRRIKLYAKAWNVRLVIKGYTQFSISSHPVSALENQIDNNY
jgi:hypothetical protein